MSEKTEKKHLTGFHMTFYLWGALYLPAFLFAYMIFYLFLPWPHIFEKEFAYQIFPNLEAEYHALIARGQHDLAENFVHYQINVTLFSACVLSIIFLSYIVVVVKRFRETEFILLPLKLFLAGGVFIALSIVYMWGILPRISIDLSEGKWSITNKMTYFWFWLLFSIGFLFPFSELFIALIHCISYHLKKYIGGT